MAIKVANNFPSGKDTLEKVNNTTFPTKP